VDLEFVVFCPHVGAVLDEQRHRRFVSAHDSGDQKERSRL
jgi:hypothetical protein